MNAKTIAVTIATGLVTMYLWEKIKAQNEKKAATDKTAQPAALPYAYGSSSIPLLF